MLFEILSVVRDNWNVASGSHCATCQAKNKLNNGPSETLGEHVATHDWMRIQVNG